MICSLPFAGQTFSSFATSRSSASRNDTASRSAKSHYDGYSGRYGAPYFREALYSSIEGTPRVQLLPVLKFSLPSCAVCSAADADSHVFGIASSASPSLSVRTETMAIPCSCSDLLRPEHINGRQRIFVSTTYQ